MTVASDRNKNVSESEIGYKQVKKYLIPNEWDLIKLGDISTKVGSGKTPRGGEAVYQDSGIPFIRSQNVLNNRLELNGISYISDSIHGEMKSTQVIPKDVLLNITGASIGRCCIVPDSFMEGNLNQHVCIIRTKDILDRNYLVNILLSPIGQNQIMNNQAGGNREGLNFEQIRKFDIPLPPLKEQQKIASILSAWYKAIELREKLIEQKKEQRKGLMQKLLTGELRLPGFEGTWKEKYVGDLISESKEVVPEAEVDLDKRITVKLNLKGIEKRGFSAIEKEGATTQYLRRSGQFIYGKQNLHKGAFGLIPQELDGFQSSSDIPAFDFNDVIDPLWFYYYFAREDFYMNLERISTGTGSKRIHPKDLYNLPITVPNISEQRGISQVLLTIDNEIELLTKRLNEVINQKKGLMQNLLTGKIRVKI